MTLVVRIGIELIFFQTCTERSNRCGCAREVAHQWSQALLMIVQGLPTPLDTTILKPNLDERGRHSIEQEAELRITYFHLCFSQIQGGGQVESLVPDHVLLFIELQLQSFELFGSENGTDSFRFGFRIGAMMHID